MNDDHARPIPQGNRPEPPADDDDVYVVDTRRASRRRGDGSDRGSPAGGALAGAAVAGAAVVEDRRAGVDPRSLPSPRRREPRRVSTT